MGSKTSGMGMNPSTSGGGGSMRSRSSARNKAHPKVEIPKEASVPLRATGPDEFCVHILQGHSGHVLTICIVGDVLFTGSQDTTIMIWDLNNLQYIGTLPGHRGFVRCLEASYTR